MKEQIKKKFSKIFLVVLYLLAIGVFLKPGIETLFHLEKIYDVDVMYATPIFNVEHSMGGLIPVGKEYYYACIMKDEPSSILVIRASKHWMDGKFDELGYSKSEQGVRIKGKTKRLSIYADSLMLDYAQKIENCEFTLGNYYYLNTLYQRFEIFGIIDAFILIFAGILGYLIVKKRIQFKSKTIFPIIGAFVILGFLLYTLSML